jgi:transposase-like protein
MSAVASQEGRAKTQVRVAVREAIVAQTGAADPASVRLEVRENRKLSPAEVTELVESYNAGATQVELSRRFGLHQQIVQRHLLKQGVRLRPVRVLTDEQEIEAVRLYTEKTWSLNEVAAKFGVSQATIRNVLIRRGVERRGRARRRGRK